MSAQLHEEAARTAEDRAVQHEALYEPEASSLDGQDCVELCLQVNPTEEHRREAARLRRAAAAHRRASLELRVAEERSCSGIPDELRDLSPFFFDEFVSGVELEREQVVVHFDRIPQTTALDLQRLVDCHLARNAALGYDDSHMPFCPLTVKGVTAEVRETEHGYDIVLSAPAGEAMQNVADRATSLTED